MGYEIKLHIGQDWFESMHHEDDKKYGRGFEEIATIDLSKPGHDSKILALVMERQKQFTKQVEAGTEPKRVIYTRVQDDEGNELNRFEDSYGTPITPIPLRAVYAALLQDYATSMGEYTDGYRRFAVAVTLIESIMQRFPEGKGDMHRPLIALIWGH